MRYATPYRMSTGRMTRGSDIRVRGYERVSNAKLARGKDLYKLARGALTIVVAVLAWSAGAVPRAPGEPPRCGTRSARRNHAPHAAPEAFFRRSRKRDLGHLHGLSPLRTAPALGSARGVLARGGGLEAEILIPYAADADEDGCGVHEADAPAERANTRRREAG